MNNSLSPLDEQRKIIKARRKRVQSSNANRGLVLSIIRTILVFSAFLIIFNFFFSFRIVHGNDMFPALKEGDLTLLSKVGKYTKNEVVFYNTEDGIKIGRIIAKADDIVDITESGEVLVNGTNRQGEIVYKTYPPENWPGPITVPDGAVFILGDNRLTEDDSRTYGFVNVSQIEGRAIALIRHNGI